jgi:hypothetical protein
MTCQILKEEKTEKKMKEQPVVIFIENMKYYGCHEVS